MDWKQRFIGLYDDVAACEAPEGTQVDDVLLLHQDIYLAATGKILNSQGEVRMTATLTRLQEIADEFTTLEKNPPPTPPAPPTPHPDCKAAHMAPSYSQSPDAALATLGKDRAIEMGKMGVNPTDPEFPLYRDTMKRLYMVCFGLDDHTTEQVLAGRGL